MTPSPRDIPPLGDIPAAHAAIAPSAALRRERRTLYQLAVELLGHSGPQALDPDIIDSPLARNRIGDALAGHSSLVPSALVGISAVSAATSSTQALRIASRPEASSLLAAALDTVSAQLGRQHATSGPATLLTEADGQRFTEALDTLDEGVALAHSVSPDLIEDLFAHIALVGVIDPPHAGRLASASPREFPGLVLIRGPQSGIEVAEALVHEGAHQKFFDLTITRDLLNADSDACPPYHPPWTPQDRRWPLEQALAAWHAYVCLTRLGHNVGVAMRPHLCGPESLLPVADQRSEILGEWLLNKGNHLGPDAHLLLDGLIGRRPHVMRPARACSSSVTVDYALDGPLEFRRCGSADRVLVGRPSRPPQLYWVSDDAATVLELLAHDSPDDLTQTVGQRWCLSQFEATHRLITLLSDLCSSGLVIRRDRAADRA
jgi:hypothetical protein